MTVSVRNPARNLLSTAPPSTSASARSAESLPRQTLFRDPAVACFTIFLALFAGILARILYLEHGQLSYSIDDPYI